MIESFSDIIGKMKYHLQHKEEGYAMPLVPKYNKIVGNILPSQYTVVTGMAAAGKTSFVDENYVLSVLLQWHKSEERPPLKVFYFSLKDTALKKLQSLLCAYIKLVHNLRVDIPTLNSQPGRLYDIENETQVLTAMDDAELFFNEVMDAEVLSIVTNVVQPSAIYETVSEFVISNEDKEVDEQPLVLLVVDQTDHLASESDGYRNLVGAELDYKFDSYVSSLVKEKDVHAVIITPAHSANSRFPKENEPNFRQLGVYGKNCDKGVVLYNPIAENNATYLRVIGDPDSYISNSRLNTLRFWHVVRNVDGIDSEFERLLFLPGTGYMMEVDMTELIDHFGTVKNFLFNTGLNPFYKDPPEVDDPSEDDDQTTPED